MKKSLYLFAGATLFTLLVSCTKEKVQQNLPKQVSTVEQPGKFKKEIVVTDESGKNSLFLAVYSDQESALNEYLKNTQLKLIIEKDDAIEKLKQNALASNRTSGENNEQPIEQPVDQPQVKKENSVIVDVVTSNFEANVKGYSLDVKTISLSSNSKGVSTNDFQPAETSAEYTSSSDFCGVVHLGWGYEIRASLSYKIGLSGWRTLVDRQLLPYSNAPSEYAIYVNINSKQTRALVNLDARQTVTNYRVYFSADAYRGHDCSMGTYDGTDCYVGTPPSGTNAFIWANNFYYTPLPGNYCPGASYDGANCYVVPVSSGCVPFIWNNAWYVRTDKIGL